MPKYRVFVREVHVAEYTTEAASPEEAVENVQRGAGEYMVDTLEFSHNLEPETWITKEECEHEADPSSITQDEGWLVYVTCKKCGVNAKALVDRESIEW